MTQVFRKLPVGILEKILKIITSSLSTASINAGLSLLEVKSLKGNLTNQIYLGLES